MKRVIVFYGLLINCLTPTAALADESLKVQGRALANYQICSEIAQKMGDQEMVSYYSAMFNDSLAAVENYHKKDANIISIEFARSAEKLTEIGKLNMEKLCLSRFDPLSRKIHRDKLLDQ